MKKFIVGAVLSASLLSYLNAANIDEKSLNISFEGYKTANKVATAGTIKEAKYTFGKNKGSIKDLLTGATAVISPKNIDMGVDLITKNIVDVFFKTLNDGKDFNVEIINVIEGENVGLLTAKVHIGERHEIIGLTYTIEDKKFEARGTLNLLSYENGEKALQDLSKAAPGHGGISWPVVDIVLTAKVK